MSENWKFHERHAHMVSFAVVGWVDVFTRPVYAEFLLKNLVHCVEHKGLMLHEFVIMPNHVHLVAASEHADLGGTLRDLKTYTSKELVKLIANNPQESRKDWMLPLFRSYGAANPHNKAHQFWQQSNRPIMLDTPMKFDRCARYVRQNPVKACLVTDEAAYHWSCKLPLFSGRS